MYRRVGGFVSWDGAFWVHPLGATLLLTLYVILMSVAAQWLMWPRLVAQRCCEEACVCAYEGDRVGGGWGWRGHNMVTVTSAGITHTPLLSKQRLLEVNEASSDIFYGNRKSFSWHRFFFFFHEFS